MAVLKQCGPETSDLTRSGRSKQLHIPVCMERRPKSKPRAFAKPLLPSAQSLACNGHESIRFRTSPRLIIVLPMMATIVAVAIEAAGLERAIG
jgi:hypothetical protein